MSVLKAEDLSAETTPILVLDLDGTLVGGGGAEEVRDRIDHLLDDGERTYCDQPWGYRQGGLGGSRRTCSILHTRYQKRRLDASCECSRPLSSACKINDVSLEDLSEDCAGEFPRATVPFESRHPIVRGLGLASAVRPFSFRRSIARQIFVVTDGLTAVHETCRNMRGQDQGGPRQRVPQVVSMLCVIVS